jgi:DNA-binding response OmpR family regulator
MLRVLVIDDDKAVRDTVRHILENAGYAVRLAADGEDGVREFQDFRPALVVTDIIMPRKEGIETIHDLRRLDAAVPIIAMSGGSAVSGLDVLSLAGKLGATRVLSKPFTRKAFLEAVREALVQPALHH